MKTRRGFFRVNRGTPVDMGPLDLAGEFRLVDDIAQGLRCSALACSTNRPPPGASVGGDDRDLDAELIGRAGLALADAFGLGGVEGMELRAALALSPDPVVSASFHTLPL